MLLPVENLPDEDDGHEDEVDAAEDEDVRLEGGCQLLPFAHSLVILSEDASLRKDTEKKELCT